MRKRLRSLAFRLLGRRRVYSLLMRLRPRSVHFSEIDLLEEHFAGIRGQGVMIDVGARHGESLMACQCRGWRIIAFEPDPANRAVLADKVDPRFVEIVPMAVSDHDAAAEPFFASPESDGVSSLTAFLASHREVARVPVTTLATALSGRSGETVDYLKIDTEGHDYFVLKGFPWDRFRPSVVACEFDDRKTVPLGYRYQDLGDYLVARGYEVFLSEWAPIERYGDVHSWRSWREYPCALQDANGWGNFLAFNPGTDLRRVRKYVARFESRNSHAQMPIRVAGAPR